MASSWVTESQVTSELVNEKLKNEKGTISIGSTIVSMVVCMIHLSLDVLFSFLGAWVILSGKAQVRQ